MNKYQRGLSDVYEAIEVTSSENVICPKCAQTKTKMFVCGRCLEIYENNHKLEVDGLMKRIRELEDALDIKHPNNERWT